MAESFPLPPYLQIRDFASAEQVEQLLDWVFASRERFKPATVNAGRQGSSNQVDPERRRALVLTDIGPCEEWLRPRLWDALDCILDTLGSGNRRPTALELEFAAHGDGAHFKPHSDIPVGAGRAPLSRVEGEDRILSAVLYFHRRPSGFSGGALRLFRFGIDPAAEGDKSGNHVDIEPLNNSFVAFPSWVQHEVRAVRCPTGDFGDYRFALNCWYCRQLG